MMELVNNKLNLIKLSDDMNIKNIFNFKTEIEGSGNRCILFNGETGSIIIGNEKIEIRNIDVYIYDYIRVSFENNDLHLNSNQNFKINFISEDGFEICGECTFHNQKLEKIEAEASRITCKKGNYSEGELLKNFFLIENLKIDGLHDTDSFDIYGDIDLKINTINLDLFPRVTGYFYFEHDDNIMIKRTHDRLKWLLKYYSSNTSSMRISLSLSKDYYELNFSNISQYSHFKNQSYFRDFPGNFFEFIKSSFTKFDENYERLKCVIDYLSLYDAEKFLDVKIPISSLILEILAQIHEPDCKFDGTDLQKGLRTLMDKLNLVECQLNSFFKENGVCCNDNFLSEIHSIRNQALHGKPLISKEVDVLLNNFIMILLLRMLDTKCEVFSTISGNVNSTVFVEKFLPQGIECFKKDEKYYLPLKSISNDVDFDNGDVYELEVFQNSRNPYFIIVKK